MNRHNVIEEIFDASKKNSGEKADKLKTMILPSSLYRYKKLDDNTLDCLNKRAIWLSSVKELNDPFESLFRHDLKKHLKEYFSDVDFEKEFIETYGQRLSPEEIGLIRGSNEPHNVYYDLCEQKALPTFKRPTESQLEENMSMVFEKYRTYIHVSCFTETRDSLLMWSHYADRGRGICIEYCLNSIDISYLFPIFYSNEMYEYSRKDLHTLVSCIIKAKEWEYEREWRIVYLTDTEKQNSHRYFKIPTPIRILLGPRFDENENDLINKLKTIASNLQIPLIKTRLSDT
jgi:Protein of unknown function (DUF2971)